MNYLIYVQKNFYKFYLISAYAILTIIVLLILSSFYPLNKSQINMILESRKKGRFNFIKSLFEKRIFFQELKRKFEIVSWKFKEEPINIELVIILSILLSLAISFCFSLISQINILLIFPLSFLLFSLVLIHSIDKEYMKKQRTFEKQIPEIGLIIKQFVSLVKPTDTIIHSLASTREKIISEEFKEVEKRYLSTHSIKNGLHIIIEKYPNSILRTLVFLLNIYNEHKKDITEEIENLVKEVEALERIKKKIEVEFARQDKTIISLIVISFSFIVLFISFNDSFKDFYSSRRGIAIAMAVLIYEVCGFFLISFFKSMIIKEKKIKRDKKLGSDQ